MTSLFNTLNGGKIIRVTLSPLDKAKLNLDKNKEKQLQDIMLIKLLSGGGRRK